MEKGNSNLPWLLSGAIILMAALALTASYGSNSHAPGSPFAQENATYCPYGYPCGIKGPVCAVPGTVYDCPAIIINNTAGNHTPPNATIAVNLTMELNNSEQAGFNLVQSMFYVNSSSECSKQLISACDNNVPSQFICINGLYSENVSSQYQRIYTTPQACPMFLMVGNLSCGIASNYCVVLDQKPN